VRPANSKVPDVTPWFWVLKLLITCMGEGISDYLAAAINPYIAVGAGFLIWAAVMVWVFNSRGYKIGTYWAGVAAVAIFGTMPPDALHVQFGIPFTVTAPGFAILVAIVLTVWHRSEGTLDIHSITNQRRALFYWLLVICTFALGTALGDMIAVPLHLGFLVSGIVFSVLILIPLAAWRLGANPVLTFWTAYILTRPIGASFADWIGQPKAMTGLGLGHPPVFITTGVLAIAVIVYLKVTGKDILPVPGAAYGEPAYGEPVYGGQPGGYDGQRLGGRRPEYGGQPGSHGHAGHGHQPQYAPEAGAGYGHHQSGPGFTPHDDGQGYGHQAPPPGSGW
jgi:uncharacterized membrane-anchored protein